MRNSVQGITPSMSRKGDCWDNAPMESFFPTLKTERVHHRVYATRNQPRRDLFHYIEGFEQSPSPALSPGLHQPSRRRAQSRLTLSTSSAEDQSTKTGEDHLTVRLITIIVSELKCIILCLLISKASDGESQARNARHNHESAQPADHVASQKLILHMGRQR